MLEANIGLRIDFVMSDIDKLLTELAERLGVKPSHDPVGYYDQPRCNYRFKIARGSALYLGSSGWILTNKQIGFRSPFIISVNKACRTLGLMNEFECQGVKVFGILSERDAGTLDVICRDNAVRDVFVELSKLATVEFVWGWKQISITSEILEIGETTKTVELVGQLARLSHLG